MIYFFKNINIGNGYILGFILDVHHYWTLDYLYPRVAYLLDLWINPFGISIFPWGAVPNMSSILFYISFVSFLRTPIALTVSYSC